MDDYEKRIRISEDRILIYRISNGFVKPTYTITEGILENGELKKTYSLSQWDDYGFNGWVEDYKIKKISFEFDIKHPLYIPLFHLLNYDKELTIDDDATREINLKYLSIYRDNNKIFIDFIDNIDYDKHSNFTERLYVFIKNILPDGRSKIDQFYLDTKKRLAEFFNEVDEVLLNKYHQIDMEEAYLLNNQDVEYNELKKVFKKN